MKVYTVCHLKIIFSLCVIYILLCLLFLKNVNQQQTGQLLHGQRKLQHKNILFGNKLKLRVIEVKNKSLFWQIQEDLVDKIILKHSCNMDEYLSENKNICVAVLSSQLNDNYSDTFETQHTINQLRSRKRHIQRRVDQSCDIRRIFVNCSAVCYSYLYGKHNISKEEELFPLALTIKIHSDANQAHRLLRFIYRKHNIYCIHIDRKSSLDIYKLFQNIARCFDNIIVIEDRVNVVYSTIRQVEAEIKCIDAVRQSAVKWKYYINLTGQEYMLKTNLEIVKILRMLNGTNDIESYPATSYYDSQKYKLRTCIAGNRMIKTILKHSKFDAEVTIRKGSAYVLMSRQFVDFVRTDSLALRFTDWLNETYAPEEMIFATLNAVPGAPGGFNDSLMASDVISRVVSWKMDKHSTCEGIYVRNVCIFGLGDIGWLINERQIVANKFYADFQPMALDCLEKEMFSRLKMEYIVDRFNVTTYKELPHSKSRS